MEVFDAHSSTGAHYGGALDDRHESDDNNDHARHALSPVPSEPPWTTVTGGVKCVLDSPTFSYVSNHRFGGSFMSGYGSGRRFKMGVIRVAAFLVRRVMELQATVSSYPSAGGRAADRKRRLLMERSATAGLFINNFQRQ